MLLLLLGPGVWKSCAGEVLAWPSEAAPGSQAGDVAAGAVPKGGLWDPNPDPVHSVVFRRPLTDLCGLGMLSKAGLVPRPTLQATRPLELFGLAQASVLSGSNHLGGTFRMPHAN